VTWALQGWVIVHLDHDHEIFQWGKNVSSEQGQLTLHKTTYFQSFMRTSVPVRNLRNCFPASRRDANSRTTLGIVIDPALMGA
jgi:hypothetical protein